MGNRKPAPNKDGKGITPMQRAFCDHYALHRNRHEAVVAAGSRSRGNAAYVQANKWLKLPVVKAYLRTLESELQQDVVTDAGHYVRRLLDWASANPLDLFDVDAKTRKVTLKANGAELPREVWQAVQEIRMNDEGVITNIRLVDKLKALGEACAILGLKRPANDADLDGKLAELFEFLNGVATQEEKRGFLPDGVAVVH